MKYDHINFRPPSGVKSEAKRGLAWRREFGRGGTAIGVARARDLSNGAQISPDTARRMKAFFDRHQSDRNAEGWSPGEKGFPSNGRIAHALWGGDAGYAWSRKLVRQMNAADEARSIAEFLEARGFCATGSGGGIDNSCGKEGGGGGGGGREGWSAQYDGKASYNDTANAIGAMNGKSGTNSGAFVSNAIKKSQDSDEFTAEVKSSKSSALKSAKSGLERKGWTVEKDASGLTAYKKTPDAQDMHVIQLKVSEGSKPSKPGRTVVEGKVLPRWTKDPDSSNEQKPAPKKKRSHEMQVETRSLCLDDFSEDDAFPLLSVETRCEGDGQPEQKWVVGYAARFGVNSLKMDDFYERIDPNAFSIVTERRGRKSPLETRALFNHDPNVVLGRFPNTLKMKVDENGLRYEILMPESRSDIVELIQRGDIRGSSFSFIVSPNGEEWSVEEGRSIRTVKSIAALVDVGPVTYPAYPDASVSVAKRSYEAFMQQRNKPRRDFVSFAGKVAELQSFLKARAR